MPHNSHFHRRNLILNAIHHLGPISRTALIRLTDYRPASVGAIINELLDSHLVAETGYASAGHGRKRILLEIQEYGDFVCKPAKYSQGIILLPTANVTIEF